MGFYATLLHYTSMGFTALFLFSGNLSQRREKNAQTDTGKTPHAVAFDGPVRPIGFLSPMAHDIADRAGHLKPLFLLGQTPI
jgi:hypothetical protein